MDVPRSNRFQYVEAVTPWERQVKEHEIEPVAVDPDKRIVTVSFDGHVVVLRLEPRAYGVGDLPLVLYDKDRHRADSPRRARHRVPRREAMPLDNQCSTSIPVGTILPFRGASI